MQVIDALVTCLAIAAAAGAMASLAGRVSRTLDVAAHFAPIWLAASLAALGLALATGETRAAILALAGAAASLAVMAPELLARDVRPAGADGPSLEVVQLNLWRWNVDVAGTVEWLLRQEADIVVLEEVVDNAVDVPAALAASYPYQQGEEGSGTWILSKVAPKRSGGYRAGSTKTHSTGAWAEYDHPLGAFAVVGFQATWPIPPGVQQADSEALARFLARFETRTLILCGDLNSTPWSAALGRFDRLVGLRRLTRACFTWPVRPFFKLRLQSPLPFLALDHIYAGPYWRALEVRVGPRLGSDHLPVTAVLARSRTLAVTARRAGPRPGPP
jgi:endonuclease/exonuclease/phosphatase (EEP) superfamily protein YafD